MNRKNKINVLKVHMPNHKLTLAALLLTSSFTMAADKSSSVECRNISNPAKRLACFDKANSAQQLELERKKSEEAALAAERAAVEKTAQEETLKQAAAEKAEQDRVKAAEVEKVRLADEEAKQKAERVTKFVKVGTSAVADDLKDPDSAKFTDLYIATNKKNGERTLCGRVNAKNSFGGYTGSEFFAYGERSREIANSGKKDITNSLRTLNYLMKCDKTNGLNSIEQVSDAVNSL